MTRRKIVFLLLSSIVYLSMAYIFYVLFVVRNPPGHLAPIALGSFTGVALWVWALYDWGTRPLGKWARLMWLIVIFMGTLLGATIYFLAVGLKEKRKPLTLGDQGVTAST